MKKFVNGYLSFINKLLPAEKKVESSIGLDIGVNSVKMVELTKAGNEYQLISWAVDPIEGGNLPKTLTKILHKAKHFSKTPFTAVFGKGTLIRYIPMPRMPLEDLRQSLAIEADKYFPFAQDQIYTDCYIVNPEIKDKKMHVLVAASKRDIIDQRMKILADAGLQPEFIGLNPIAVANAIHTLGLGTSVSGDRAASGKGESAAVAVLDMGETVSNLTVLQNMLPAFTRDIYTGGQDLTQRIANAFEIDVNQAEELKRNPGDRAEEIINACDSALSNLLGEMRLSFDYFTTENNEPITKLYLTGGGSMLKEVENYFKNNLEIEIERWNPLDRITVSEKILSDELKTNGGRLGVALGLALYQFI